MSKSIKLNNDCYWDSSSIMHKKIPLNNCILDFQYVNMSSYKSYWCRVATCVFTGQYRRFYGRLMVENDGYEPAMADIWFSYYSQNSITSDNPFVSQTKILSSVGAFSYSNRIAVTIEGKNSSSVRVSLWIYEPYNYSSINILKIYGNCNINDYTKVQTLPGEVTYLT